MRFRPHVPTPSRVHPRARHQNGSWLVAGASIPQDTPVIETTGATGPLLQSVQAPLRLVAGPNETLAFHESRKVKRLSAFSGAGIPPGFARFRICKEFPRPGRRCPGFQRRRLGTVHCGTKSSLSVVAQRPETTTGPRGFAVSELGRHCPACRDGFATRARVPPVGTGARQGKRRALRQSIRELPCSEFLLGNGRGGYGVVVREAQCLMDPTLQEAGVQPALPAKGAEHGPADPRAVSPADSFRARGGRRSRSAGMEAVALARCAAPIARVRPELPVGVRGFGAGFRSPGLWTRQASWLRNSSLACSAQGGETRRSPVDGGGRLGRFPVQVGGPPGSRGRCNSGLHGTDHDHRGGDRRWGRAVRRRSKNSAGQLVDFPIVAPIPRSGRTSRGIRTTRTFERAPGPGDHCGFRNSRHQGVPVPWAPGRVPRGHLDRERRHGTGVPRNGGPSSRGPSPARRSGYGRRGPGLRRESSRA